MGIAFKHGNADRIMGVPINDAAKADGRVLAYDAASGRIVYAEQTGGGGGGVPEDHTHAIGDVTGLQAQLTTLADDAAEALLQAGYGLNAAQSAYDLASSLQVALDDKAPLTHAHAVADVTGLQANLDFLDGQLSSLGDSVNGIATTQAGHATTLSASTHLNLASTLVLRPASGTLYLPTISPQSISTSTVNNVEVLNLSANVENVVTLTYASDEGTPGAWMYRHYDATTDANTLVLTGNGITAAGTITAASFSGSGAGLTNIPATSLTGTINVARIPTAIPATSIGGGLVDNTEFGHLNGVTSGIQAQLNAKASAASVTTINATLTGYETEFTTATLTATDLVTTTSLSVNAESPGGITLTGDEALLSIVANDYATGSAGLQIIAPDSTYVGSIPAIVVKHDATTTFSVSNTGSVSAASLAVSGAGTLTGNLTTQGNLTAWGTGTFSGGSVTVSGLNSNVMFYNNNGMAVSFRLNQYNQMQWGAANTGVTGAYLGLGGTNSALGPSFAMIRTGTNASAQEYGYFWASDNANNSTGGTHQYFRVTPSYNQLSGTASNTDLLINRTQTAVGSGVQLLLDAQVGGASKCSVSTAAVVFLANSTGVPASNPVGGGYLYVESGALKYRGSGGTVTTVAAA